jgi:hypothetical protein
MALTHQDGATLMTQRLKPTKRLALQVANMLALGALAPDEDLDRHVVREVTKASLGRVRSTPSSSIS